MKFVIRSSKTSRDSRKQRKRERRDGNIYLPRLIASFSLYSTSVASSTTVCTASAIESKNLSKKEISTCKD